MAKMAKRKKPARKADQVPAVTLESLAGLLKQLPAADREKVIQASEPEPPVPVFTLQDLEAARACDRSVAEFKKLFPKGVAPLTPATFAKVLKSSTLSLEWLENWLASRHGLTQEESQALRNARYPIHRVRNDAGDRASNALRRSQAKQIKALEKAQATLDAQHKRSLKALNQQYERKYRPIEAANDKLQAARIKAKREALAKADASKELAAYAEHVQGLFRKK